VAGNENNATASPAIGYGKPPRHAGVQTRGTISSATCWRRSFREVVRFPATAESNEKPCIPSASRRAPLSWRC